MTVETPTRFDPLADALAALEGWPEAEEPVRGPLELPEPAAATETRTRDLLIIDYSGDLEKVWATMILASTSAAMGVRTRVFVTFWGLQVFVKDSKRITGENWMQKMMSAMQRPGVSHRKLSKMNFFGMGSVMLRAMMKEQNIASLEELMAMARDLGVKSTACTMSMDAMGVAREELVDGLEFGGVAAFMADASRARFTLFI